MSFLNIVVLVALIAALFLLRSLYRRYKPWYGVGWLLQFNEERGTHVTIATRLLESSSGRAKVKCGSILLSWDGTEMCFSSNVAFNQWRKSRVRKKVGDTIECRISEPAEDGPNVERTVILEVEKHRGEIPTYRAPMTWEEQRDFAWHASSGGMCEDVNFYDRICPLTGVRYQKFRFVG